MTPEPRWEYVQKFHSRAEANQFLEMLLAVFAEYDGKVVAVQRDLPALAAD